MDINNDDLTSTQLVSINLSDDRQYLMLTEKKLISLRTIDLLAHEDERIRQAYQITRIFDRYIDHSRRLELVERLKDLLTLRIIELKMDDRGEHIVNVLRNKGQAAVLQILLSHFTQKKIQSLNEAEVFNTLKHLLMQRMQHQSTPIHVNSISVTLRRAVDHVLRQSGGVVVNNHYL